MNIHAWLWIIKYPTVDCDDPRNGFLTFQDLRPNWNDKIQLPRPTLSHGIYNKQQQKVLAYGDRLSQTPL